MNAALAILLLISVQKNQNFIPFLWKAALGYQQFQNVTEYLPL